MRKTIFCAIIVSFLVIPLVSQAPEPSEIDLTPFPMISVAIENGVSYNPVIFVESDKNPPVNSAHIGNFEVSCAVGPKNCKIPLKVYRIE